MDDKFKVLRDTREKEGNGWNFIKTDRCLGTKIEKLYPGDYSIDGLVDKFVIERKGSISEFVGNLYQDRFYRELDDLNKMEHPYLILEFDFGLMDIFPKNSGIPMFKWDTMKLRGPQIIKTYHEMRLSYPNIRVDFVGASGKSYALSLFKRVVEVYGRKN